MVGILKPAAHIDEIPVDKQSALYKRLRWQIFMGIFIGYAGFTLFVKTFRWRYPF